MQGIRLIVILEWVHTTEASINRMEGQVVTLNAEKRAALNSIEDSPERVRKMKKLDEKISFKKDMIDTLEETLASHVKNLRRVNKEGEQSNGE